MAESETSARTVAGGTVLGAFGYASMGTAGWHVAERVDVGGLTEDAVAEGARLIERLPWWPEQPLALGVDPYQRPRRLAWLGSGTTPRRFLVHTIHAENDASNRPDNNYTECLVVGPAPAGAHRPPWDGANGPPWDGAHRPTRPGAAHTSRPESWSTTGPREAAGAIGEGTFRADVSGDEDAIPLQPSSPRPSQLWSVEGWATPWGPDAVAHAHPGRHRPQASRPVPEVIELIVADPGSLLRVRSLLAALHRALHLGGPRIVGLVDDLVWGAVLLDTALALLPASAAWDVTFDLRSLPPAHRFSPSGSQPAMVRLLGHEHQQPSVTADALDLTAEASDAALEQSLRHSDDQGCPRCGQWHASMDRLLRQGDAVTPAMLQRQLTELAQGMRRLHGLAEPRSATERARPRDGAHASETARTRASALAADDQRLTNTALTPDAAHAPGADPVTDARLSDPRVAADREPDPGLANLGHANLGHSNLRPTDGWTERRPPAAAWSPPGTPRSAGLPSAGRSRTTPTGPVISRTSKGTDLWGVDQGLQILGECHETLVGFPHTPAVSQFLLTSWQQLRDLADEELARIAADPATGSKPPDSPAWPLPDPRADTTGRLQGALSDREPGGAIPERGTDHDASGGRNDSW